MDEKINRFLDPFIYLCLFASLALGIISCMSWYFDPLVANNPHSLGMAFNTALGIIVASIATWFATQQQKILPFFLGIFILVLGVTTLLEHLLHINFDIDALIIESHLPLIDPILHIKMAPNTAIAFILLGLSLTCWKGCSTNTFSKMITLISTLMLGFLGVIALIGYLFHFPTLYTWSDVNFMAMQTAISFLLLSCALLSLYYKNYSDFLHQKEIKVPTITCVVLFTLLILFWQAIDQYVLIPIIVIMLGLLITGLLTIALYLWQVVKQNNVLLEGDIDKLKSTEDSLLEKILELNLVYKATSEVAQSNDIEEALQRCVDLICEMTAWPVGHAYLVKEQQDYLASPNIWYTKTTDNLERFQQFTAKIKFYMGTGIPGTVWQTKKAVWVEDICLDKNLPRAEISRDLNIHGGVGFPILSQNKVIAILEFFSHKSEKFNKELMRIFHILSLQVGHVLERKNAEKQLDHLAHYDPITELPNRNYFHETMKRALAKAVRSKELIAILFLDVDHFKNINDSLGHHLGDLLLKEVGKLLQTVIRETDFLARLGGDEFVILTESLNNIDEAEKVAERIIKAFRAPIRINNTDFKISMSIGIAVYPFAGDTAEKLLQNADTAMYQAKEKGRHTFQTYTEQLHEKLERAIIIEQELRFAIERNELSLVYQPIFDLTSNKVTSVEALLRWNNASLNDVTPIEFIPIAETTGLIVSIGEWVFKEACKQMSTWQTHFQVLQLELTVNCSVFQLDQQQRFINYTKQIIKDYQLPSNKIILELTETGLMKQVHEAVDVLAELTHLGFSVAIDDFGSGYSSLNYLKSLPISILKIDRAFTKDLEQSTNTQEITKAIIQLAKILKLSVVAEGVETEGQLKILKEFGCQYAQGFYLAKPMTASECEKFIEQYL